MELTIDVPEKVIAQAAARGLPVTTYVSQVLKRIVDDPPVEEGSVIELFAMPAGSDLDFDPPRLRGPLYRPADLT